MKNLIKPILFFLLSLGLYPLGPVIIALFIYLVVSFIGIDFYYILKIEPAMRTFISFMWIILSFVYVLFIAAEGIRKKFYRCLEEVFH